MTFIKEIEKSTINSFGRAGAVTQNVESLTSKYETLSPSPSTRKK
jgi:hypothetical protein